MAFHIAFRMAYLNSIFRKGYTPVNEETTRLMVSLNQRRDLMLTTQALQHSENFALANYVIEFWDRVCPLSPDRQEVIHFEMYVRAVHKLTHRAFCELLEETRSIAASYSDRLEQLYYEGK